ncbi:MAG: hydrogenase maturation nickel metallochaperone HypA [Moorellales bacterium]
MHEFALVQSLLTLVEQKARENRLTRVHRVKIVVGRLTMALPEALRLAFEALSPGTVAEGAELEIEEREVQLHCPDCGLDFSPREFRFSCPRCGHPRPSLLQGRELYLDFLEGEDGE